MAEVYKRERSPYWYFDMTVNGKRKRVSTRRTVKSEAKAVAMAAQKQALDRAQMGGQEEITLRAAIFDHYLPSVARKSSYVHLKRYAEYVCGDREGVVGLGGDTKLHELSTTMIQQYRSRRLAQGMSEQSIDHEIKVVSAAYNMVAEDYHVRQGLKFPMARPKGKPRYLTPDEEKALLVELRPDLMRGRGGTFIRPLAQVAKQRVDNYDLVVCLLDTGCRYGELARLTWSQVDTLNFAWVNVLSTKVDKEGRLATTARMREVLQRRWSMRGNSHHVFKGWHRDSEDEPRVTTAAIRRAMANIGINSPDNVRHFGKRDVRSLRDTFATKLVSNGVDLHRVQKLLHHASPQMTQKYAHLAPNLASQGAVELLDKLNGG